MRQARWIEHELVPHFPLGTSKGTLHARTVWYLLVEDPERPGITGMGEAAPFPGHSLEFPAEVRTKLLELCADTAHWEDRMVSDLVQVPSVRFAVEQALRDLEVGGTKVLFPSEFTLGRQAIPINGLVWMGDQNTMRQRLREQVEAGFATVKVKIGAIGIDRELEMIEALRSEHGPSELTVRVDANGAFDPGEVDQVLDRLAALEVHSIEQPLAAGRHELMAELCARSPVPIALDEDLIGMYDLQLKKDLLDTIRPQHIVIKPSLVGGWTAAQEWIDLAEMRGIGWWITSALESNIGLNAIAQWTATLGVTAAQGLGTGRVFTNNIPSPLHVHAGSLHLLPERAWDLAPLLTKKA